ncbi:MAG: ATP-binding protein [Caldilineaceae bacterium]
MQPADTIHIELPAKYENLALIRALIATILEKVCDVTDLSDLVYNMQLATHEVCLNIIQHAYGHENGRLQIDVDLKADRRAIEINIYDAGQPFDMAAVAEPNLEEPQSRGYGLFIAKQLLDALEYHSSPGSNHWRLYKQL